MLQKDAQKAYDEREALVGEENMRELERRVVLSVLDRKWRDHLYEMDYLREGIYLRAYSQRDPLVEYQREGFDMFQAMMDGIKEESVGFLFNLEVEVEEDVEPDEIVEADTVEADVEEPTHVHEVPRIIAKGSRRRSHRRTCPTPAPPRTARQRSRAARSPPTSTIRSPTSAATPTALWLGQEVQEVPRCTGRADRPDHARQRLRRVAACLFRGFVTR